MIQIFIAAHERLEAMVAYQDWLTPEQMEQLDEGEHDWWLIREEAGCILESADA